MSQNLTPPVGIVTDQTGIDEVIAIIQERLTTLDWLEVSLGRVRPAIKTAGGLPEPWIYKEDGESYRAYPNDTLKSFTCLYAHDDETIKNEVFGIRTLSVICWANLKTLGIEPPTVEGLKQQVIRKLLDLYCVLSVNKSFDQTTAGATGIYPGFDVSGLESSYLSYPYGGFRIELTVHYTNLCNS
ncbi:hypothetical protein [Spirosoma sp. 48-14]|uniref:hypothetical protein n=1 Tax=Spirosoma sp. 48-14 TaxID=1895854 RepID=UPI00095A8971|nr:hypothetical protein [Spirosoma sp. 48-14]OJW78441.1 MAG: hypothetical protein BGO59_31045 [Spirosoma sp. 48-14]